MIEYCEAIAHSPSVLILRIRYANEPDLYSGRDTHTGHYVSGLGSYQAVIAALGLV